MPPKLSKLLVKATLPCTAIYLSLSAALLRGLPALVLALAGCGLSGLTLFLPLLGVLAFEVVSMFGARVFKVC